jgi:hypothetical protein
MDINLADIEWCYQTICYGYAEPDKLLVLPPIYDKLRYKICELYNRVNSWPSWMTKREAIMTFNNCKIIESYIVPENAIVLINTKFPNEPRYQGLFYLADPNHTRHDVPVSWIQDLLPIEVKTRFPEGAEL